MVEVRKNAKLVHLVAPICNKLLKVKKNGLKLPMVSINSK